MLPQSLRFFEFFLIVFFAYWLVPWRILRIPLPLPGRPRLTGREFRTWLLLGASLYYLATFEYHRVTFEFDRVRTACLLAPPVLGYALTLALARTELPWVRKGLLITCLAGNLGLLFYFKYANFFLESWQELARGLGLSVSLRTLLILLPVGISFCALRFMSYVLDVYHYRLPAERNLARYLLYLLFFPDLIAGPVRRAHPFLAQLARPRRLSGSRLGLGAEYWAMGLAKKFVVADRMAEFADPVFLDASSFRTAAVWVGLVAYALQLYCDYSGYLDMAAGTALLLGFRSVPNFNMPYLATSVADFWQRFNTSVTTWLREYVYLPLSGWPGDGRRTTPVVSVRFDHTLAVLVTAVLGGLWCGAGNTFLLFGLLHGVLLVCNGSVRSFCRRRPQLDALLQTHAGTALRRLVTFALVCATFAILRSARLEQAGFVLRALAVAQDGLPAPLPLATFWTPAVAVALCHAAGHFRLWQRIQGRLAPPAGLFSRGFVTALLLATCFLADRFLPLPPHIYISF